MAAILQTTFGGKVSYWESNFTEICFPRSINMQHWLFIGFEPNRWQDIVWTNYDLVHWRIYALIGLDELKENDAIWTLHVMVMSHYSQTQVNMVVACVLIPL